MIFMFGCGFGLSVVMLFLKSNLLSYSIDPPIHPSLLLAFSLFFRISALVMSFILSPVSTVRIWLGVEETRARSSMNGEGSILVRPLSFASMKSRLVSIPANSSAFNSSSILEKEKNSK